jgi:hypothetical protein
MGTIYRVTVVAETTDTGGGYEGSDTLFELAGGADIVGRLAPAAVVDALLQANDTDAVRQTLPLAERVMDSAAAAGAPIVASADTPEQAKRKRRTRQQIADDNTAQNLGFRDHAHRMEVESQQGGQPTTEGPSIPAQQVHINDAPPAPYNPFAAG